MDVGNVSGVLIGHGISGKGYILFLVQGTDFDERAFFQGIAQSGARALLIGRRALVALGLPLLTADYDFWVYHDVARFNAAVKPVGLVANHTPEEVSQRGRYVLENDEHVDVLATRIRLDSGRRNGCFRGSVETTPDVAPRS